VGVARSVGTVKRTQWPRARADGETKGKAKGKGRRPTKRCSEGREARFSCVLVRPFAASAERGRWVPRPLSPMCEAVRPTDFVRGAIVGKLKPAGSGDYDGRVGIADQLSIISTRLG
jgi:hypothetical protein